MDWVPSYQYYHGVYSGTLVICLHCKGCTFIPCHMTNWKWLNLEMAEHELYCPAYLDHALALLH